MKTLSTRALVLGRLNFGEADKILTLLTKSHGKISVIAKGVRKPKSKLAGGTELFTVNDILFTESKSDLKTLVSARAHEHYGSILKNLHTTQAAYDVIQFAGLYTEPQCEEDFYNLTVEALAALNSGTPHSVALVWFGLQLLQLSGHAINTEVTNNSGQLDHYVFDSKEMTFYQHPSGTYTKNHIKVVRLCVGNNLIAVQKVQNLQHYCSDLQQDVAKTLKTYSTKNL